MIDNKLATDDMVIIGEGYRARLVRVGGISAIEVLGNDITVHVNGEESVAMRRSLGYCKARLPRNFFAANRRWLVNLAEVHGVNTAQGTLTLIMKDGMEVGVSKLQSRVFRKAFSL